MAWVSSTFLVTNDKVSFRKGHFHRLSSLCALSMLPTSTWMAFSILLQSTQPERLSESQTRMKVVTGKQRKLHALIQLEYFSRVAVYGLPIWITMAAWI